MASLGEDFLEVLVADFSGGHRELLLAPVDAAWQQKSYMKYDVGLPGPLVAGVQQRMGDQVSLLEGQTAVVTGGARGLGYAIAELFIAEGAQVVIGDLDLAATEAAAKELGPDSIA